jgi:hypothetical protein
MRALAAVFRYHPNVTRKRSTPRQPKAGSNPAAADLARLRWKGTTKAERQESARKAAKARWDRQKQKG